MRQRRRGRAGPGVLPGGIQKSLPGGDGGEEGVDVNDRGREGAGATGLTVAGAQQRPGAAIVRLTVVVQRDRDLQQALQQLGGEPAAKWRTAVERALVENQRKDGSFAGSFDPISVWGEDGGRVVTTALALLSLQAAYRYQGP